MVGDRMDDRSMIADRLLPHVKHVKIGWQWRRRVHGHTRPSALLSSSGRRRDRSTDSLFSTSCHTISWRRARTRTRTETWLWI